MDTIKVLLNVIKHLGFMFLELKKTLINTKIMDFLIKLKKRLKIYLSEN